MILEALSGSFESCDVLFNGSPATSSPVDCFGYVRGQVLEGGENIFGVDKVLVDFLYLTDSNFANFVGYSGSNYSLAHFPSKNAPEVYL